MEDPEVFNRLASELSMDDRKSLLEKLGAHSGISNQPMYDDEESPKAGDEVPQAPGQGLAKEYEAASWLTRLVLWIIGLFTGKSSRQVFIDRQVAQLGRSIEEQSPGLYDFEHDQLLPNFHQELSKLKESARFFYDALDMSVNRDKGAFYVFLASLEMDDIHRRLLEETDPKKIAEQHTGLNESALRQLGVEAMESCIATIGDDRRTVMYYNARTLSFLRELSSFLFDRLLGSFAHQPAKLGKVCSAHLVNNYLRSLNNILFSLKETPPMTLLESLFIFILQDRAEAPDFNMEEEMKALLSQAEKALLNIRHFNKTVPLTKILRCAERDMSLLPMALSGGEDWFSLYKEYWKQTVEKRITDYTRNHRSQELLDALTAFFSGAKMKTLAGAESVLNPVGIPLKGAFCLSFLATFYSTIFMKELNLVLRPILIDGEFFKKENLAEFTESYNEIFNLGDAIRLFEGDISNAGELGKRYTQAKLEVSSLTAKRHKVQLAVDEASDEAKRIIDRMRSAMTLMKKVLKGLLTKSPDGKFDTLTNLAEMSGKTDTFTNGISATINRLNETLAFMAKIDTLEAGR
ncbi:hypothetical protein TREPR_3441 [Treponema primitia ZAS-2]|uniref:Uncharacterized protein n=1 Tax=Treponema primitia (strain ATCC BAA-887 / DSM 12427 / ZAS-2) TaxID=545694 RepID=F5YJH9_TREPZ|nr:DUF5312 family protein [Treponema primitia]AEF84711.1 hypothetical protein TREPR_3441 [Treponema primitia ZAS-2]